MTKSHTNKKERQGSNFEGDLRDILELTKQYEGFFMGLSDKILHENMLPKDALGVDSELMKELYSQAFHLYNTGKYGDAIEVFRMLVMFDATEPKYALGLAASHHLLKEYDKAVELYTMCAMMEPENPIPPYHTADCFIKLQDPISAMISLEMAIRNAGNKKEYAQIKEKASLTLGGLEKNLEV